MKFELRQVFKPVQPAVKATGGPVQYRELQPDVRLCQFIYCYWRLRSTQKLSGPFTYRVIPDGCIDIFFNTHHIGECRAMGFSTCHTDFTLEETFDYIGIRFLPAAFSHLFRCNAATLTNRDEALFDIDSQTTKYLIHKLEGIFEFETIKKILDHLFLKKFTDSKSTLDNRLLQAIWEISKAHGSLTLKNKIDTAISPRQLRRLFECYVGTSPKMFGKVVRFQYFFQLLTSSKGNHYNKLIYDAGYYDQPHFNRDFKSFFGLSPTAILKG